MFTPEGSRHYNELLDTLEAKTGRDFRQFPGISMKWCWYMPKNTVDRIVNELIDRMNNDDEITVTEDDQEAQEDIIIDIDTGSMPIDDLVSPERVNPEEPIPSEDYDHVSANVDEHVPDNTDDHVPDNTDDHMPDNTYDELPGPEELIDELLDDQLVCAEEADPHAALFHAIRMFILCELAYQSRYVMLQSISVISC